MKSLTNGVMLRREIVPSVAHHFLKETLWQGQACN